MSLPFISETAAEVHRLAIAGSSLAAGDYRLKKLIPSLEGLAAKAPIFGRIASAVNAVVEGSDPTVSGRALLDLSSLLTAIQYTQSPHEVKGEFTPLVSQTREWVPTTVTHRSLSAVIEALTTAGQGRLEIVRDALDRGLFRDLRLMKPAVEGLNGNYGELSELITREVIPKFGPAAIDILLDGFDPKGGKPHARRVTALCGIDPEKGREFCRKVLESANKEVKLAVIEGLTGSGEDLETILDLTRERSGDVRKAALLALQGVKDPRVLDLVKKALDGKDAEEAAIVAATADDPGLLEELLQRVHSSLALPPKDASVRLALLLRAFKGGQEPKVLKTLIEIHQAMAKKKVSEYSDECRSMLAGLLFEFNSAEADQVLIANRHEEDSSNPHGAIGNGVCFALPAAARRLDAEELFEMFGPIYKKSNNWQGLSHLLQGQGLWNHHGGVACLGLPPEKISPRWVALAIKKGDVMLVSKIAKQGDADALKFLLSTEVKEMKNRQYGYCCYANAIVRLDPDLAPKYLIQKIEAAQQAQAQFAYLDSYLFSLVSSLPATKIPELESLSGNLIGPWKERFEESLSEIRHRTSQSTV